jgi:hypothetical protein
MRKGPNRALHPGDGTRSASPPARSEPAATRARHSRNSRKDRRSDIRLDAVLYRGLEPILLLSCLSANDGTDAARSRREGADRTRDRAHGTHASVTQRGRVSSGVRRPVAFFAGIPTPDRCHARVLATSAQRCKRRAARSAIIALSELATVSSGDVISTRFDVHL